MWILFVVVMGHPSTASIGIASTEFHTQSSCNAAASVSNSRPKVVDAWCVKK